eukprot:Platyproteum_vivax@DN6236_c0_g1_i3.p2
MVNCAKCEELGVWGVCMMKDDAFAREVLNISPPAWRSHMGWMPRFKVICPTEKKQNMKSVKPKDCLKSPKFGLSPKTLEEIQDNVQQKLKEYVILKTFSNSAKPPKPGLPLAMQEKSNDA